MTFGEVPSLVDDVASHRNIRNVLSRRSQIISVINALKGNKATRLHGLSARLLRAAIFTYTYKSWESRIFSKDWKKGILVKITKIVIPLECEN